jgi:mRNA interferase MazF
MVRSSYIPSKGDLLWFDFDPQAGREQSGRRPAVAVSPKGYNKKTGLVIVCPVTSNVKGYPFEVEVSSKKVSGAVLADQLKSLDWVERRASFIEELSSESLQELQDKIQKLIIG